MSDQRDQDLEDREKLLQERADAIRARGVQDEIEERMLEVAEFCKEHPGWYLGENAAKK